MVDDQGMDGETVKKKEKDSIYYLYSERLVIPHVSLQSLTT